MATSTTQKPKKPTKKQQKLYQMEPSGDLQIPPDSPEFPAEPEPAEAQEGAVPLGPFPNAPRSKYKGGDCDPDEGIAYWRAIPKEFYPRLIVYVNREKPVLNRLQELTPEELFLVRSGKKRAPFKYIDKTIEPWPGDTRMEYLNRYGSGICRLYINDAGAPGHRSEKDFKSRTLCKFTLSYYDSEFPTVLDPSRPDKGLGILELNHPENQSYVADLRIKGILPAEQRNEDEMGNGVVNKLVDKMTELQDRVTVHDQESLVRNIVERVGGNSNGQSRASEMVDTIKAVKELLPQPPPAAPPAAPVSDPVAQAVSLATTMMQMKTDNPMLDLYRDEMKALREELKEAHREMRDMQRAAPAAAPQKDLIAQIVEIATDDKKLEPLKKLFNLFGGGGNGDGAPARSGRTTGFDIVREVISSPFGANLGASIGQGAGMLLAGLANRNQAPPPNGQPMRPQLVPQAVTPAPAAITGETTEQRIGRIGATITEPMLYQFFLKDAPGDEFAQYMNAMWPEDFEFLRSLGAENIISRYQQYPPAWQIISPRAPTFTEFITEFCSYDPNEDEAPAGPPADDGVVDLTAEGGN